jgi:hypothetical protein
MPPPGRDPTVPPTGIRLDVEGAILCLALTPFHDGASPAGDAVDLSRERGTALTLDANIHIEANTGAGATRGSSRDIGPGELVDTDAGLGIGAFFGRHASVYRTTRAVSIKSWKVLAVDSARLMFGDWRLRIDIDGLRPIYWKPEFITAARSSP